MMLRPTQFHDLVSGRTRGVRASLARTALQVAEYPYSAAMQLRNWRYDHAHLPSVRVPAPVISVGNITLGGTGKTPMVEWLARWLLARGVRPAIVSRGYAAQAGKPNDEALELAQKLPDVPHVLDRDRVRGAHVAISEDGANLILLDDAFQHRRIARDLDIVLVDALEPFGYGHVFPRGTLREPLEGWRRAHVIALSRADAVSADVRQDIARTVRRYAPDAAWVELTHSPRRLMNSDGVSAPLEMLAGKHIAAFCGIGNPQGFLHVLGRAQLQPSDSRELPDHFAYPPAALDELAAWLAAASAEAAVCTCKDLVKIDKPHLDGIPLWAVDIELQIESGQQQLENLLDPLAQRALAAKLPAAE